MLFIMTMKLNLDALSSQKSAGYNSTIADHELNRTNKISTPIRPCKIQLVFKLGNILDLINGKIRMLLLF